MVEEGIPIVQACEAVDLARSTFKSQQTIPDGRFNNKGRAFPGFTVNRDGEIIPDEVVVGIVLQLRSRIEYSSAMGVDKLRHWLIREHGYYINRKKIFRLCRENGCLLSLRRKRKLGARHVASNRKITGPKQLWQFDVKYGYVHGENRFFFVLAFIDAFTRKVVGNHVGLSCKTGAFTFTLKEALAKEGIKNEHQLVIRSDNGPQMSSVEFASFLKELEVKLSHEFIPVRTPNKNAHIESFFSILEIEYFQNAYFHTFAEAYEGTKSFIENYNKSRLHSSLRYRSPMEFIGLLESGMRADIEDISM